MGYTTCNSRVRAEFFKDYDGSMKWYATESLDMSGCWDLLTTVHAVALAWHFSQRLLVNFRIVVLDPYHRNSYPVMLDTAARINLLSDLKPDVRARAEAEHGAHVCYG